MKIFIAGPRALSAIDKNVQDKLDSIINQKFSILVGDANGIDKAIQKYFFEHNYKSVFVYASRGRARNNIGKWDVQNIEVPESIKGFDFYATKDKAMADNADYGLMIWNGKSKGTLNNIINLTKQRKNVLLYFTPHNKFYLIRDLETAEKLASYCGDDVTNLFLNILNSSGDRAIESKSEQLSLFDSDFRGADEKD